MWLLPTSNSIPNVFVCSGFHPTWQIGGALFSSKPRRWAHWSSPPRSRGWEKKKCMLVIWVLSATAAKHRPVLTEGCLVSGSALCPAVCLSLSKCVQGAEHHASTEWLTNPRHPKTPMWAWFRLEGQISASELVYCSPDEPKVHEIVALSHFFFFFVPVSKRTHTLFAVWSRMQRNKQWMCIMLQGGRGKTTSQQHMWMPS